VVHHVGVGTTTTATRAGAPHVVVPQIVDQPYWAGRVAELGIGAAHDGPTPTTESLSAALKTTLTPETRARAKAVASTIRTDGARVAVTLRVSPHGLLVARMIKALTSRTHRDLRGGCGHSVTGRASNCR
jgi:vancomycin aglycone glucosyltransferase